MNADLLPDLAASIGDLNQCQLVRDNWPAGEFGRPLGLLHEIDHFRLPDSP